jgi:hypothetical protein
VAAAEQLLGEAPLEFCCVTAGCKPEVERGIDQRYHFVFIEDTAGDWDGTLISDKLSFREGGCVVLSSELKDLRP